MPDQLQPLFKMSDKQLENFIICIHKFSLIFHFHVCSILCRMLYFYTLGRITPRFKSVIIQIKFILLIYDLFCFSFIRSTVATICVFETCSMLPLIRQNVTGVRVNYLKLRKKKNNQYVFVTQTCFPSQLKVITIINKTTNQKSFVVLKILLTVIRKI